MDKKENEAGDAYFVCMTIIPPWPFPAVQIDELNLPSGLQGVYFARYVNRILNKAEALAWLIAEHHVEPPCCWLERGEKNMSRV